MKSSRPKRTSADKARGKWNTPNVWSPQKGIQRNPKGHNATNPKCLKRKLDYGTPSAQKVGGLSDTATQSTTGYRKRKVMRWTKKKGTWNQKEYDKRQQMREELRLQAKQRRISECNDNLNELESLRARKTDKLSTLQVIVAGNCDIHTVCHSFNLDATRQDVYVM